LCITTLLERRWQRMGWTGRAPAPNGSQSWFGAFEEHEERIAMACKRVIPAVHTIGIDTGKNTLHLLDWIRRAQSCCAKKSLGAELPHGL
jgi:hypothetical protein